MKGGRECSVKSFRDSVRQWFCHLQHVASKFPPLVTILAHEKEESSAIPTLLKAQSRKAHTTSAAFH